MIREQTKRNRIFLMKKQREQRPTEVERKRYIVLFGLQWVEGAVVVVAEAAVAVVAEIVEQLP